jgi:hypothetical protein
MADVYGEIGGQPVELNNAATEATLKALLATMTAMLNSQSKDTKKDKKIQTDLEAELRRLAKASKTSSIITEDATAKQKKANKAIDDAAKAQKKYTEELEDAVQALGAVSSGLERATLGLTGMVSTFANLGNSISSAAAALNHIPIAGRMLSGVFGAVAGAAEKSYKAFQQSSSVGATFGGSITSMVNAAGEAGLTFEAFTAIIAKNGENLTLLGAGTEDGAKKLAKFGKEIKNSDLGNQLARLGYSTEDINEGFLKYAGYMAKSGRSQADIQQNLVAETGQYLKNLDAVSKLTGKNKEALQAEADARRQDSQFRVAEQKLNKDDRKTLDLLMSSMSKTEQEAFKGALATGTYNDAMVQLQVVAPDMARALMDTALKARASGRLSEASALGLDQRLTEAAKASQKNTTLQVAGANLQGEYNNSVVDTLDRAARTSTLQDQFANQAKASTQTLKDGIKPEDMKAMQERLAGLSNQFNVLLSNNMPALEKAFTALASATPALVSVFTFLMDNIKTVIATFVALKVAQLAYKAALVLQKNKEASWGKTPADARWVRDTDSGGIGGDGKGKKGKKGKVKVPAKAAGAVLGRLAGPAAAAVAIGGAAMELSDINDELKKGNITEADANKKKSEAVGGGIGGAGGGIAGAMAGAAIGSVVPVVGTVIGGIIGGAIGAWGGEALGRKAGSAIGGPKPSTPPGTAVTSDASQAAYLKTVAMLESGGNTNAKAGTSSASGMFQFTEGTWKQMTKEMGKNYSLDDRFDPTKSAEVMSYFTNKQKAQLEKGTGRSASSTDMYMAHFLGAGGATKFLNNMQTNPNASAAQMDPKAAAANKSIFYDQTGKERSLQEVYGLMAKKVSGAEQKVASGNVPISVAGLGNTSGFTPSATSLAALTPTPSAPTTGGAGSAFPTANPAAALSQQMSKQASLNKPVGAGQESAETLLSSLNNKMDILIQISSGTKDTNEKQLRAQRSMASVDMYTNIPA